MNEVVRRILDVQIKKNEVKDILRKNIGRMYNDGASRNDCAGWIHNDLDAAGFLNTRNHVREYEAMQAVMGQIDPATIPGLTVDQRVALARFAKPQRADSGPTGADKAGYRGLVRWAASTLLEIDPAQAGHDDIVAANDASVKVILGLGYALGERHGKQSDFWNAFLFENPDFAKALNEAAQVHSLTDEAIAKFWPSIISEEGKAELRADYDALMVQMYAFEPQQWMGQKDLERKLWYSHDGAMNLIADVCTVTTLSYEECVLIYARGRGFIRDDAPIMASPYTGKKYERKEGKRHV